MEGDSSDYNSSSGDTHRNSAASGPVPLGGRDKGEVSKKKASMEGAEGRRLAAPVSDLHSLCVCGVHNVKPLHTVCMCVCT